MKSGGGQSPPDAYAVMGLQRRQNLRRAEAQCRRGGQSKQRSKAERGGAERTVQRRRAQAQRRAEGAAASRRRSGGREGANEAGGSSRMFSICG